MNRSASSVLGEPCFPTVGQVPEVPDLVVVCVPAAHVSGVVDEALLLGTRAFLVITAGVVDAGPLAARVREVGGVLMGPNSLGLFDADAELHLAWGRFVPGSLAIVSQSGQLGSELAILGQGNGLGVSRFFSLGNQVDLGAAEALHSLVDHQSTRVVALYLESFAGGRDLVAAMRRLRAAGKTTIVITTGASDGSRRLAQSHTGSLTSATDAVDAACRAAGAVRVDTPRQLVNLAHALVTSSQPAGPRVAIISDSGGQGGVAADSAVAAGLQVQAFTPAVRDLLARQLPDGASCANPVDLAGAGEADLMVYPRLCQILFESEDIDQIVLSGYFGCYGEDNPSLVDLELEAVERLASMAAAAGKPLLVHSMSRASSAVKLLGERGIPVFNAVEDLTTTLAHASHLAAWPGRAVSAPDRFAASSPAAGYWSARQQLELWGVEVVPGRMLGDTEHLPRDVTGLHPPYVLKAGWLAHKSERGGVRLGISDVAALRDAHADMSSRLGAGEYVVEEQDRRPDAVEVLVGARRDPAFGPMITVGAGGTETELHRDVCTELAPVDRATARSMLDRLRIRPLLDGWRGRPGVDVDALVEAIVSISVAIATEQSVTEIEINPLRVSPLGARALDALIITDSKESIHEGS